MEERKKQVVQEENKNKEYIAVEIRERMEKPFPGMIAIVRSTRCITNTTIIATTITKNEK